MRVGGTLVRMVICGSGRAAVAVACSNGIQAGRMGAASAIRTITKKAALVGFTGCLKATFARSYGNSGNKRGKAIIVPMNRKRVSSPPTRA